MKTCLIIDESSVVRKVATRIVFQLGFEVETQASLAEARAAIGANALPALLVVAASGGTAEEAIAFVRQCRARPDGRSATLLALLVEANLGLMTRLKRAGVDGFLYKPFTRAELTAGLQPYLAQSAPVAA